MRAPQQDVTQALKQAAALHRQGRLAEAEPIYRRILQVQKHNPDATHLLAMLLHQRGESAAALDSLNRLLAAHPRFHVAENSRGLVLGALGRHEAAVASFDRALAIDAAYADGWMNRGNALAALRRIDEAVASYDRALAARPDYAEVHYARANALRDRGDLPGALAGFERALALRPAFPEALNNRAGVLERLGRSDEALADYARASAQRPGFAEALNNRGVLLDRMRRHDEAQACFERALAARPGFKGALLNLAEMYYVGGRQREALDCLARCLAIDPADPRARVGQVTYQLPVIYRDDAEVAVARAAYAAGLEALRDGIEREGSHAAFIEAVGASQPFHLAYQGQNDRALQRIYGELVCRIGATLGATAELPRPAPGERIRVGIVSSHFRLHTVWHLMVKAWATSLDPARFEVFGYYTGAQRDACTAQAAAACARFAQGPKSLAEWRGAILAERPHVLLFPEIGMDAMTTRIAAQRLARVQCNSWGHPETSGFPTLDYFLSSDGMEPADGEAAYTERLVRLPHIGVYYEPSDDPGVTVTRAELGLPADCVLFWCCQSLFKYLPRFDDVFARIAREVPGAHFAFIEYPRGQSVTEVFRARLAASFVRFGLDHATHCTILKRFDPARFAAAFGVADVVLDSIGWSGGHTTLQSLAQARPIVAMASALMRGRHTAAMLARMGLHELVAETLAEYVAIAGRLGRDAALRAEIGARISAARGVLYQDREVLTALEDFLEGAARAPKVVATPV